MITSVFTTVNCGFLKAIFIFFLVMLWQRLCQIPWEKVLQIEYIYQSIVHV